MVATVLTACGIETNLLTLYVIYLAPVATVLTACGIETLNYLKHDVRTLLLLQQCLPLAVLKLDISQDGNVGIFESCNSAYRLRY